MAKAVQLCRICLNVNVKMFTFKNTNMESLFESLTKINVDIKDRKPTTVCFLCYARLRQCKRLQQQAIKSNELLEQLLRRGFMPATEFHSSQDLHISSTYHLDLEPAIYEEDYLEQDFDAYSPMSVQAEEVIDDTQYVTDCLEDTNECYDFAPEVIYYDQEDDPLLMVETSEKCLELEEVPISMTILNGKKQRKRQEKDCHEDQNECYDFAPEVIHYDQEDDPQLMIGDFNKCDEIKDVPIVRKRKKRQKEDCLEVVNECYDFAPEVIHYDQEDDPQLMTRDTNKSNEIKDIPNRKKRRKEQKDCLEDVNEFYDNAPEVIHYNQEDDQQLISRDTNKSDEIKDIPNEGKRKKRQKKDDLTKLQPESETQKSPPSRQSLRQRRKKENVSIDNQEIDQIHIKSVPLETYRCDFCSYETSKTRCMETHLKMHNATRVWSCSICKYMGAHESDLKRHLITHTGEKPFACDMCDFKTAYKNHLKTHMRTHTGERPFSCNICEYTCAQKGHLIKHIKHHAEDRPFACNYCTHRSKLKQQLKEHLRTHTGEKPFSCSICDHKCAYKFQLKQHMLKHIPVTISCNICEYRCEQKLDFKRHMVIHTDKFPFSCNVCFFRFKLKAGFRRHMKTHVKEKPFSCVICEFRCAKKSNLDRHMNVHEKNKTHKCTTIQRELLFQKSP